ncbi:MAG: serine/threonine-protein kinase, partial [Myxococcota bacterium]
MRLSSTGWRLIGTTLDKYEVLQKVGEGGMATVYRGRHSTLDRTVAIKILHPHLSSSTRNRLRFAREVEAIERLRHENILEILDFSGNDVSDCYIVTEFVDGETLTAILHRRGKVPSEVATLIGLSLCRALGYAHSKDVLHRDVKTDNVMVRNDGTVKLMDFGIARFLDASKVTMTGALVGSPAFMSPEQAKEGPLDQRSDLFALGTVLYDLVTGMLPFTGSNPSLILKNVIEGNRPHVAELAPTMSASLADVIERLMATNADDRFNTAADVERHLLAVLAETRIRVDAPEWSLAAWLHDPDEYEKRLDAHLRTVLVDEGRQLLASGDHLAALRLLNRLLSMDEDNAEVLALVQGLHGEPAPVGAKRTRLVAGVALIAIGFGVLVLSIAARRVPAEPEPEVGPPDLHLAPPEREVPSAIEPRNPTIGVEPSAAPATPGPV